MKIVLLFLTAPLFILVEAASHVTLAHWMSLESFILWKSKEAG